MKNLILTIILFLNVLMQSNIAFAQESDIYSTAYVNRLQDKVESNWVSTHGQIDKKTVVIFKINKNGQILNTEISESSGDKEFDAVALIAVKSSEPFEKFPTNIQDSEMTINFTFSQNLFEATQISDSNEIFASTVNKVDENKEIPLNFTAKSKNETAKPTLVQNKPVKLDKESKIAAKKAKAEIKARQKPSKMGAGTHGYNRKVTPKSIMAGVLSLVVWPGLGQLVNGGPSEKAGTHAVLGIINVFRLWSCYDAVVDRQGGVLDDKI